MHKNERMTTNQDEARIIFPSQLISVGEAAAILGIDRTTLTRKVKSGAIDALAKLEGRHGAYVFDRADIKALVKP